jgi:DNA-damage-inducible protein J
MAKDTSISIRVDSETKQQLEQILTEIGLNMTSVVNMLFRQIVRDKAIPLSLSLNPHSGVANELLLAQQDRSSGFVGRNANEVAAAMESIISEVEDGKR